MKYFMAFTAIWTQSADTQIEKKKDVKTTSLVQAPSIAESIAEK